MKRGKMSNPAEMETNAITTSSTGVVTTMPFLHRNIRDTSQDSLLTVSGGLSTTGALVTPDLVVSGGRDSVVSSRDVEISSGREKVISSGRDLVISRGRDGVISSGRDRVISSGRDGVVSSGRDGVISSGRDSQGRS